MIEQRAHDVLARIKKRPLGKMERDAVEVIEALLADRAEYVEIERIQLRKPVWHDGGNFDEPRIQTFLRKLRN